MFARSLFAVLPLLALVSATSTSSPNRLVERQTGASRIQSLTQENLCVTVMGGQPVAGATIQIAHCFDDSDQNASLQKFTCSEADEGGFLSIALECSPNLCIDRGSDGSEDGSGLQLQECIVGTSSAQKWQHDDTQIFSYFGPLSLPYRP
uniref:Uncharacterized protein n=1 Tax=Kwoniella bestiolae CBS 10118 TaxID=1296100 RepID=A0A1B9G3F6_9TREE|nr:hypothetical protein I302_05366 [Kwoniella bestiolae CBS 10118]OCF25546.1 hypothetical protein I302_05366 [Kwoniella bestiolae CBS 10118]